jgi:hypothetical protein
MQMSGFRADRRRFLKLVGASALTYPFLRGLPSYADAGATNEPIYLVLLYTSCGVVRPLWGAYGPPATGGSAVVTPLSSSAASDGGLGGFRPTLSAFRQAGPMKADLTDQVIVLDGLNNAAANCGSHEPGMASLWTGSTINSNGSNASGQSIDQAIATALVQQGVKTNNPYIALYAASSCDEQTRGVHNRMLYAPPPSGSTVADYVDPLSTPSAAMNVLFPTAAKGTGPDPGPIIRKQVNAQVNSELTALASRVCTDDRIQLQSLQAMWNQAETQLTSAAAAAAACTQPSYGAQPAGDPFGAPNVCGTLDPFPFNISAMSNILAMSLACDLTRVASLQLSQALSPTVHYWNDGDTTTHHVWSHEGPSYMGALMQCNMMGCGPDPLYSSPVDQYVGLYPKQLAAIDAFYAAQVASFAYSLSQLTTRTGKNLLDQTIICWGSELDMGALHNHDDTPFLLIGGKNSGKVRTGQLVRFPLNVSGQYSTPANHPPLNNRYHNDLLLTLASIMGVNVGSTFGTTRMPPGPFGATSPLRLNTGPITEILT